jgi:hypothetical protein
VESKGTSIVRQQKPREFDWLCCSFFHVQTIVVRIPGPSAESLLRHRELDVMKLLTAPARRHRGLPASRAVWRRRHVTREPPFTAATTAVVVFVCDAACGGGCQSMAVNSSQSIAGPAPLFPRFVSNDSKRASNACRQCRRGSRSDPAGSGRDEPRRK